MFVCVECECLFEDPKEYTETHGLEHGPYEHFDGCPICGGAYVETHECALCGWWIVDDYIELNDGTKICSNCYTVKRID